MKKFFYFAFAAVVALANVACGDDDDNNGGNNGKKPVTLTKAVMADDAATYQVITEIEGELNGKKLKELSVNDGGEVSVTVGNKTIDPETGAEKWTDIEVFVADLDKTKGNNGIEETANGKKFHFTGSKLKGDFEVMSEVAGTRGEGVQIEMNFTINGKTFTTNGTPAECAIGTILATGGAALDYVCHKFQVKQMIIDLKNKEGVPESKKITACYKEYKTGNLIEIYNTAQDNGANLTAEDKKSFEKVVKYVSVSRNTQIIIEYADGTCDSGNWNWLNAQAQKMEFWLKDKGMGNKFIPENPTVDLEFSGNECSMTIHSDVTGSKEYTASLTFIMSVVQ